MSRAVYRLHRLPASWATEVTRHLESRGVTIEAEDPAQAETETIVLTTLEKALQLLAAPGGCTTIVALTPRPKRPAVMAFVRAGGDALLRWPDEPGELGLLLDELLGQPTGHG